MNITDRIQEYLLAAHSWLKVKKDIVNNLNIFPVPDGDTGTNMLNTVASAAESVQEEYTALSDLGRNLIKKALWGARGNSGVILANFFKGFFNSLSLTGTEKPDFKDLAQALKQGRDEAYTSAIDPVEGTILTLIKNVHAKTEELAADPGMTLAQYIDSIYSHSRDVLETTPELLDVLKKAGVVDAGACGFFYIIEAVYRNNLGLATDESAKHEGYIPEIEYSSEVWNRELDASFCLEIIMKITDHPTEEIVSALREFGTSEVAINSGDLAKIHLHTDTPEPAILCAEKYAQVLDVYRENMLNQQYRMLADIKYAYDGYPGIASVVSGNGMGEIFRELGVQVIIDGGRTMNPSVAELAEGIKQTGKENVILIPNNRDAFLSAREAVGLVSAQVHIIDAGSMPEGIAVLMNYSPAFTFEENIETMAEALKQVEWNYITRAERDTPSVQKGQYIAGQYRDILSKGSLEEVAQWSFNTYVSEETSLVTLYTGENVRDEDISAVTGLLKSTKADMDIECIYGGQPHYNFLFSYE